MYWRIVLLFIFLYQLSILQILQSQISSLEIPIDMRVMEHLV